MAYPLKVLERDLLLLTRNLKSHWNCYAETSGFVYLKSLDQSKQYECKFCPSKNTCHTDLIHSITMANVLFGKPEVHEGIKISAMREMKEKLRNLLEEKESLFETLTT